MKARPFGINVVAALMIIFGAAEIVTAFTHSFFGLISTDAARPSIYAAAGLGLLYVAAGLLVITMRKWAVILALASLLAVIVGRLSMVVTGLYPTGSFLQNFFDCYRHNDCGYLCPLHRI